MLRFSSRRATRTGLALLLLWVVLPFGGVRAQWVNYSTPEVVEQTNVEALVQLAAQLKDKYLQEYTAAVEAAKLNGWPIRDTLPDGRQFEIRKLNPNGLPIYYVTDNRVAAASIGTDKVWPGGSLGLVLAGTGMTVGEWDGGAVLTSHGEFTGRATQTDGSTDLSNHATHVAGTMMAAGNSANAKGMAYQASLSAHDWDFDTNEMATAASQGLLLSNHSYGYICGWTVSSRYEWWGDPSINSQVDYKFGYYDDEAQAWDQICVNAPFYLPVKSAGNDRGDEGPGSGSHYVRNSNGSWVTSTATRNDDGPYDCIAGAGTAKNILTVGAVNDVAGGYNGSSSVSMSSFSGWGPTDDGRIKPDVVANGVGLYSTSSNGGYTSMSGTSMASPSACGSLILLQQHYRALNGNQPMRAATLKALAIHTADECGPATGPDYQFGWGLLNIGRAAQVISGNGNSHIIRELTLNNSQTYTTTVSSNGSTPLTATICWTDPAGNPASNRNNPTTPMLVNDLDIRISGPGGTFQPYILNPANPSAAATTGDNTRDNVEKIYIAAPQSGTYTITVTHKGSLSGSSQRFALVVSGVSSAPNTCSGLTTLTSTSGTVTDGSGGSPYNANLDCTWLIQPTGATSVTLTFTDFSTESGNDLVRVYDGPNASSTLIGIYSGTNLPAAITSSGGSMFIRFTTNGSTSAAGWSATYTSNTSAPNQCSGQQNLTAASGTFSDGSTSGDYINNADCKWLIQPTGATSITLSFSNFRTEAGYDFVNVYDGSTTAAPRIGQFSGNTTPAPLTSSGGTLLVEFVSDQSQVFDGWSASYTSSTGSVGQCSGNQTLTASTGTLSDGSGSQDYINNANCSWLIQPPGASAITLTFTSFATEQGYDFVKVYNGTSASGILLGDFSGTSLPNAVTASSGAMYVVFTSDNSQTAAGWSASYTSAGTSGGYCSGSQTLTAPSGTITDGSGQDPYSDNSDCTWLIQPPGATAVELRFSVASLENNYDYVRVYDGATTSAPVLAEVTGTTFPSVITSTGGTMLVRFTSDGSMTEQGFTASYQAVGGGSTNSCDGNQTLTTQFGTLTDGSGPNDYVNEAQCSWLIQPAGASRVSLRFQEFALEDGYDFLRVYNGASAAGTLVAELTGNDLPDDITINGGSAFVEFTSDQSITEGGFVVDFNSNLSSVNDAQALQFTLGPNPAQSFVDLAFSLNSGATVTATITDVTGKELRRLQTQALPGPNQLTLDLAGVARGVYLLQLTDGQNAAVQKLVVQ